MTRILAIAALGLLTACATHPDQIAGFKYAGDVCTDAKRVRLAELVQIQKATARNDAVGVFLIGLPMGSIAGTDHKAEIARLKGACGEVK